MNNDKLKKANPKKIQRAITAGFAVICALAAASTLLIVATGLKGLMPAWAFSMGIDSISLIACAIIYYSVMHDSETADEHNVIFAVLLLVNSVGLAIDLTAWAIEGNASLVMLSRVLNSLLFATNNTLFYVFWMYVSYAIGRDRKVMVSSSKAVLIIYIIAELMCLTNIFTPVFFEIDDAGTYHRTVLYPLSMLFMLALLVPFVIRLKRSDATVREKVITSSFFVLPIASQLVSAFNFGVTAVPASAMIAILLIHGVLVADRGKKLEVTRTELDMAAEIQSSMMPNIFPAFPERREFDIYAIMEPAREVGGDFYDFFLIDDDHLGIVMADVSGKGVPASLFMMISKIIIQNCAMLDLSAADILNKTNEAICSNNPMEMFVTVWIGILDLDTGRLTAANAGHEYPALKRKDSSFGLYRDAHGLVAGAYKDSSYKEYEIMMSPGDKLFLYTDGVTEAANEKMAMFGTDRMIKALNKEPGAAPKELIDIVGKDIRRFRGSAEQFDDITMLCVEYTGR